MDINDAIDAALSSSRKAAKTQAAQGQPPKVVGNRRRNVFIKNLRANGFDVFPLSERDELRELLRDAYNTWGDWPQETLARIAAALNGGGDE